jgi:His/Glu/Gln/Arg/opine family amino acid ABC transporter permease subunit
MLGERAANRAPRLVAMEQTMNPAPTRPDTAGFPRRLALVFVIVAVAAIGLALYVAARIAPRLISGSFAFLTDKVSWDIPFSFLPYSSSDPYWWAFLVGLTNTVGTGAIAICTATLVGFVIGVARLSRNRLLADLGRVYVDVVRNIPLILQASFWYAVVLHLPPVREAHTLWNSIFLSNRGLFLPKFQNVWLFSLTFGLSCIAVYCALKALRARRLAEVPAESGGRARRFAIAAVAMLAAASVAVAIDPRAFTIEWPVRAGLNFRGGFRLPPEFVALLVAITIYRGAFIAEVFRGGLQSVARGQLDAAHSLGLRPWMVLVKIRLPLALISIVPALSSEFIIIMKVTSIGIVVGFWDLFAVSSNSSMMTGQTIEVLFVMVVLYVALNYVIVSLMNFLNNRVRLPANGA